MKIGFFASGLADLSRPELLATAACTAECVGLDTLWTDEHIVFFDDIRSKYPYARTSAAPPVPGDIAILNPFASVDETVRVIEASGREWVDAAAQA